MLYRVDGASKGMMILMILATVAIVVVAQTNVHDQNTEEVIIEDGTIEPYMLADIMDLIEESGRDGAMELSEIMDLVGVGRAKTCHGKCRGSFECNLSENLLFIIRGCYFDSCQYNCKRDLARAAKTVSTRLDTTSCYGGGSMCASITNKTAAKRILERFTEYLERPDVAALAQRDSTWCNEKQK